MRSGEDKSGNNQATVLNEEASTMGKTKAEPKPEATKDAQKETLAHSVTRKLGLPPKFEYVNVIHLYDNRYRANVMTRTGEMGMLRISDSHFLTSDNQGTILTADPPLAKKY